MYASLQAAHAAGWSEPVAVTAAVGAAAALGCCFTLRHYGREHLRLRKDTSS